MSTAKKTICRSKAASAGCRKSVLDIALYVARAVCDSSFGRVYVGLIEGQRLTRVRSAQSSSLVAKVCMFSVTMLLGLHMRSVSIFGRK